MTPKTAPKAVVLCFLLRDTPDGGRQVLLGHKKTGFGTGKIVGPGGKVEPGESLAEAASRELQEETGILAQPRHLKEMGAVLFEFPSRSEWDMHATVFVGRRWSGEPTASCEIDPEWFDVGRLPVEQMWQDAEHWLPRFLAGERFNVRITLAQDHESVLSAVYTEGAYS
jgi:8-oxo-dGTP diphosphatase